MTDSPIVFLMLVDILLLFIGTLINASAAVVILTPILLPVALGMGITPCSSACLWWLTSPSAA